MTDGTGRDDAGRDGSNEDAADGNGIAYTYADDAGDATESATDVDGTDPSNSESEPLGDLAATVAERSDADHGDSDEPPFDDLFDRRDVDDIDTDRLWERLETDESAVRSDAVRSTDRTVREVEKRAYCQDCEHFADPPETACTREGTDILAVPTITTFRVADCPVVREDEALEDPY